MRRFTVGVAVAVVATGVLPVAGQAEMAASDRMVTVVGGDQAVSVTVARPLAACVDRVDRVAGADRYATAALLAATRPDATTVFLASGTAFADATAAAPLVAAADAVLLLTRPDRLPDATRDALEQRQPARVVVLGGTAAVSAAVADEVAALGPAVERLGGRDRFDTAVRIARRLPDPATVLVASGRGFADALAVGPVAADDGAPILLVEPDTIPPTVASLLDTLTPDEVVVVGGPAAVSDAVVADLAARTGVTPTRLGGADRYGTAAAIASARWPDPTGHVTVATGGDFADALAVAGLAPGPLLLVGDDLDPATAHHLQRLAGGDCRQVDVTIAPDEAVTLGPSEAGGTRLSATAAGGRAVLARADDAGALLLPADAGTVEVTLAYPTPAAGTAVTWTQTAAAAATTLEARQPWRGQRPPAPGEITLAWQYTGDSARYRDEVASADGITVTAPFRYYLGTDGTLVGRADPDFIADMHARGVDVWPTIHTCGARCIAAALDDPDRRASHARTIVADAAAAGADGINIDIEGFETPQATAVTAFVQDLAARARAAGLVTSFDLTVMTDTWHTPPEEFAFWSTAPDRRAISEAVDYAVLMAYDQFNRFRPAGPVASPAWVEEALRYQLRFTDADRLLLGVPLYGRVWDGTVPTAVGIGTIESYVASGRVEPDPRFGVDRVTLRDGRVTWAETVAGLHHRVDLVDEYGLAGTASWRLGFDTPSVWSVLPSGRGG